MSIVCSKDINLALRKVSNAMLKSKKVDYYIPNCLLNILGMLSKILIRFDLNNYEKREVINRINDILKFIDKLNEKDKFNINRELRNIKISEIDSSLYEIIFKNYNNGVSLRDELRKEDDIISSLFGDNLGYALSIAVKSKKRA